MTDPLKVLFVATEMAPLVKVGGLGEVVGALPAAMRALGHDVRVLLPACSPDMIRHARLLARLPGRHTRLLELPRAEGQGPVWLLSSPALLRRGGRPYLNRSGHPWADNPVQFARLSRVAADLALGRLPVDWQPDVVHCHDWHTALTALWMREEDSPAASVFTIHNLGYMGRFDAALLPRLGVSPTHHHIDSLEFHGDIALIKAGLIHADQLTTVSPSHAREIRTPDYGCGLEGLLETRREQLTGILNGIDTTAWNPATDPLLAHHFNHRDLARQGGLTGKARMRDELDRELNLVPGYGADPALAVYIGRLVEQKGIDRIVAAIPALMARDVRLVVLGEGDRHHHRALETEAREWPGRVVFRAGFDEALSHRLYAGADLLLMPSRYEPCGLSQLHAMRYGTVPIVSRTGGLLDTVMDPRSDEQQATGFLLDTEDTDGIAHAVDRALACRGDKPSWNRIMKNAMTWPCDWSTSAEAYEAVYRAAIRDRRSRDMASRVMPSRPGSGLVSA
ncbi:MAG: glycogen synthase GlgA [Pseudomonadota bacterium]